MITFLNRKGFNTHAVKPAAKAFLSTMEYIEELGDTESHGLADDDGGESASPIEEKNVQFGGAKVGDFIQWESQGALQFSTPQRVRMVSEDGMWLAVEGSETGLPMNEVIVEKRAEESERSAPPVFPMEPTRKAGVGEEWFRAKVGSDKQVIVFYRGDDEIGASEIQKLIDMLAAQKKALED